MQHALSHFDPMGSLWNRWYPHIHVPGTALNDQYKGSGAMDEFIRRVEASEPRILALGVTDYFGMDGTRSSSKRKKPDAFPTSA